MLVGIACFLGGIVFNQVTTRAGKERKHGPNLAEEAAAQLPRSAKLQR